MDPMGRRLSCPLLVLPVALLAGGPAFAQTTIHVPDDVPTIQGAIALALPGDTVLVKPGLYPETLNFLGKAITVKSEAGPATTIVDAGQTDSVVTFTSAEGPGSVLEGLTLRNGNATPGYGDGGGIRIESSSPTILNNVVRDNSACAGAGVSVGFGSPLIQGNVIISNRQAGCSGGTGGGGIGLRGAASAQVIGNVIAGNAMSSADGGGLALFAAGTPTIRGNVISGNTTNGNGGGISLGNSSNALIAGNLIVRNRAFAGGGIAWLVPSGNDGPQVVSNTIADNQAQQGSGIDADGFDAATLLVDNIVVASPGQVAVFCGNFNDLNPPLFHSNDVFSPSGTAYGGICSDPTGSDGNISADPMFVDATAFNYRLRKGSAAIDAGDDTAPGLPATDLDGLSRVVDGDGNGVSNVDMGAFERNPPRCGVDLTFDSGTLNLGLELYTPEPARWSVLLAHSDKIARLWSVTIPAVAPPTSFSVPIRGFPNVGTVGVLSVLQGPTGVTCVAFDIVDTGGLGASAKEIQLRLERMSSSGLE